MKKLFKAVSVMAMASMLMFGSACGGGSTGETPTDKDGNTIIKIMFHVDEKSAEGQAYKKRIDAFNAAYKDQKIKASASYVARTAGAAD